MKINRTLNESLIDQVLAGMEREGKFEQAEKQAGRKLNASNQVLQSIFRTIEGLPEFKSKKKGSKS